MENRQQAFIPFEWRMNRRECIMAMFCLPLYVFLIPWLVAPMLNAGTINETQANFICYAAGALIILLSCWGYLRRDFDTLCDHPFFILWQILGHYGLMMLMNMFVNSVLLLILSTIENPNHAAVERLVSIDFRTAAALAVCLAPIMEEVIFRGAIFGELRKRSRLAAYLVSMLLFSLYHVWGFIIEDWRFAVYLIQYLPVSYLLCRLYERTSSIWSCIFMHMLINGVAMNMQKAMEGLM